MKLTIKSVDASDFGSYKCVAKNSLGDTDGAIKLYRKHKYCIFSLCFLMLLLFLLLLTVKQKKNKSSKSKVRKDVEISSIIQHNSTPFIFVGAVGWKIIKYILLFDH